MKRSEHNDQPSLMQCANFFLRRRTNCRTKTRASVEHLQKHYIAGLNVGYRYSGFWASFATSVLAEGQHTLSLKIVTADKKGYYEADQEFILEVR